MGDKRKTKSNPSGPGGVVPLLTAGLGRTVAGGLLMGVANIIPGVSGGTMILALGLYERFVESVADITRLRFRLSSFVFLGILGTSSVSAIMVSVGPINWGLAHQQHLMFATFIGLTLGGVPLLWKAISPVKPAGLGGAAFGLAFMVFLSFLLQEMDLPANFAFLFLGGFIGSAAMVLPGISGSYLLLALGLYFPITDGIEAFFDGLKAFKLSLMIDPALQVMLPVGLGVLAGIAGLTNLLQAALKRFHDTTMGSLLGLLIGSIFFLYPFREPGHKDPFEHAAPLTPTNIGLVLLCIALGFGATLLLSRLGREDTKAA